MISSHRQNRIASLFVEQEKEIFGNSTFRQKICHLLRREYKNAVMAGIDEGQMQTEVMGHEAKDKRVAAK